MNMPVEITQHLSGLDCSHSRGQKYTHGNNGTRRTNPDANHALNDRRLLLPRAMMMCILLGMIHDNDCGYTWSTRLLSALDPLKENDSANSHTSHRQTCSKIYLARKVPFVSPRKRAAVHDARAQKPCAKVAVQQCELRIRNNSIAVSQLPATVLVYLW